MKQNLRKASCGIGWTVGAIILAVIIYIMTQGTPNGVKDMVRTMKDSTVEKVVTDNALKHHTDIDGWHIIDSMAKTPSNQLITYTDDHDSLMALAGHASEVSEYNFVRYLRNKNGSVYGFINGFVQVEDTILYHTIRYKSENNSQFEKFLLKYDVGDKS